MPEGQRGDVRPGEWRHPGSHGIPCRKAMTEADSLEQAGDEDAPRMQPTPVRVIAWLTVGTGVWSLVDEAVAYQSQGVRWLTLVLALTSLVGAIALLRRRRWGYLVVVAYYLSGVFWVAWFLSIHGDYTLSARLIGVPVLLFAGPPLLFLLSRRARSWHLGQERSSPRNRRRVREPDDGSSGCRPR